MRKIRVGVIGAGNWALTSHLPNLAAHDDVEFVGVASRGGELLLKVQELYGFTVASEDYRDVLEAGVDLCVVASPTGLHYEHARAALESGAHVLCEKAVTIEPAHAWDLVATADRMSRHLVIAFGWNYRPLVKRAKRLMDDVGIGQLEHMSVHMSSPTRELLTVSGPRYDADSPESSEPRTWTDPTLSGGGYGQAQLSHALGLAMWLTGARAESGFALMNVPTNSNVEVAGAIAYRFEGGAVGSVSGGSAHRGAGGDRPALEVRAIGSRGQILVDVEREALWHFYDGVDTHHSVVLGDGAYDCVGPIDAVLSAARGEQFVNQSPGELGAHTVEALDLAYRSAESGRHELRR